MDHLRRSQRESARPGSLASRYESVRVGNPARPDPAGTFSGTYGFVRPGPAR
jgi:hypothetical protein